MFLGVISTDELPSGFDEERSTFIEKLGAGTDKFLQEFFCKWGTGKRKYYFYILHFTVVRAENSLHHSIAL